MKFGKLHSNIKIRLITDFFTDLTQMAIFPFMAIYFSSHVGQGMAGILLMVNVGISILAGLFSGYLSDRLGRKKMMAFAQILQVVALSIITLANSPWFTSVWLTYSMFLVSNISSSLIGPAANAMIIDVSTEKERTYIYGFGYWTGNIAIALGASLGGLLFENFRFILFILFLAVSMITLVLIIFFIKESLDQQNGENKTDNAETGIIMNYWNVLKDRGFMLFVLATIFVMSLEFQLDKYIAVRLKDEFNGQFFTIEITGIKMFSIIMLINTITIVLATLYISKWLSRYNSKTVLTVGLLIYSVSFSVLAFSNTFFIIIIAALLFTLGELMYAPVRQTVLAGIIDEQARASYMAVDSLAYNVAMLLGSLGLSLGALIPSSGMAIVYFLLGIIGLICYRYALGLKGKKARQLNEHKMVDISLD